MQFRREIVGGEVRLYAPLDQVMLDPANARKHPERNLEGIKASLARYGQQTPVVLDDDGVVLKGNGTTMAARSLGWPELWVTVSPLHGVDRAGYAVADNQTGLTSEWDELALATTLEAIRSEPDFPIEATGFTDAEVDALLEKMAGEAAGDDDEPAGDEQDPGEKFELVVACSSEGEQRRLFDRLTAEGHTCRVLTL